ncbi:hypothetical protein G9A89_022485 [Geosiphon pyriformis]|nr:hypothetical protein G9A89_022485 [Geosiphon pyriformis]
MNLAAASGGTMSKKKAPIEVFHGPVGGFFSQKKRISVGNVKHSGDKKNISLVKPDLSHGVYSDMDSVFGDNGDNDVSFSVDNNFFLGSVTNISKVKKVITNLVCGSPFGSINYGIDEDDGPLFLSLKIFLEKKKKLTNSQRRSKTILPTNNNNNPKDINYPKDEIKITLHHFPITSPRIAITVESLATGKEIAESCNETNKIGQSYYQPSPPAYYPPRPQYQNNYYQPTLQPIQQQYQQPPTQHYQVPARRLITQNQFTPQN